MINKLNKVKPTYDHQALSKERKSTEKYIASIMDHRYKDFQPNKSDVSNHLWKF